MTKINVIHEVERTEIELQKVLNLFAARVETTCQDGLEDLVTESVKLMILNLYKNNVKQ